jgi:hypothetical protein
MSKTRPQHPITSSRPCPGRRLAPFAFAAALLLVVPCPGRAADPTEGPPTARPGSPGAERPAPPGPGRPGAETPSAVPPGGEARPAVPPGPQTPAARPGAEAPPASPPGELAVAVEGGALSVDVSDADLEQVLQDIATRAGFKLTTSGRLGRVTATFDGVPVEQGLRRLARDNELVFVYGTADRASDGGLAEVRVFGASSREASSDADALSDVDELLQRGDAPENTEKLTELLGSAAQSEVRARAAWALGRIGGSEAETALTGALSDEASDVRVQALYALQRVAGVEAVPAIQGLLLRDADVVVRRAAARTLGMMREPPATEALRAAAEDPDATVRREVSRALRRHGVPEP